MGVRDAGWADAVREAALPSAAALRYRIDPSPLLATAATLLFFGLTRLLPAESAGLALRLLAAMLIVLVLPGALMMRALGGHPLRGVTAAASLALSLAAVFVALVLTFAAGSALALAVVVVVILSLGVLVPATLTLPGPAPERAERRATWALLAAAIPLGALAWWAAGPLGGDDLFHVARARKLGELDALPTLGAVNEFADGSLHPGYAFPLWHGVLALVARVAGVDVADVALYLPVALVPFALLVAYGAGVAVFRSWAGGVALTAAQVAHLVFSRGGDRAGSGALELLATPPTVGRALLAPAILALAFTFAVEGRRALLVPLAAASLALSSIHPTYVLYVALLLVGFLLARLVIVRAREPVLARTAVALGAILVSFGLFLLWLYPVAAGDASTNPSEARRAFELRHYGEAFDVFGEAFRFAPEAIARGGPVVVAGLLAVPFAALAARRLWAALVLGGSLAILIILLMPQLFTLLSDAFSVSQSRRLSAFLPIAFAVAGAAVLLGRLKLLGVGLAAGAAVAFELLYPGEFTYKVAEGGPGWVVWFAAAGGALALAAGAVLRRAGPEPGVWAAGVAVAFLAAVAAFGLAELEQPSDPDAFPAGLVGALQREVEPGDVLFADLEPAYQAAAYAPAYINAAPTGHVASTRANRPRKRRADAWRFFLNRSLTDAERDAILGRYRADWLLVDRDRRYPRAYVEQLGPAVYDDGRYALYDLRRESTP